MQTDSHKIAYFGKVPGHGDFVRHQANGAAVRAMNNWLQQGVFMARPYLTAASGSTCSYPFYFAPRDIPQVFVGVLQPSRDSVGRAYPFLVGFEAEALDGSRLFHAPAAFQTFFEEAAASAQEAAAGRVSPYDLAAHTERLNVPGYSPGLGQAASYEAYLKRQSLKAFWERLWGYAEDLRKYYLFKNLLDILMPLREQGLPGSFPLVLRFPLSPDGQTSAYDTSFWLEVCLRLLGLPHLQPSFFWMMPDDAETDREPFLILSLRAPTSKVLSFLFAPDLDDDSLCVLEAMSGQRAAEAALAIPSRIGSMLESEHLTLWDFLHQL